MAHLMVLIIMKPNFMSDVMEQGDELVKENSGFCIFFLISR